VYQTKPDHQLSKTGTKEKKKEKKKEEKWH
jgi:hypothetical protein